MSLVDDRKFLHIFLAGKGKEIRAFEINPVPRITDRIRLRCITRQVIQLGLMRIQDIASLHAAGQRPGVYDHLLP
jgi:hypothetical protein